MINLNYAEIPLTIEEDINKDHTTWADGKCVKFEDEISITYYVMHKVESRYEDTPEGETVEKKVCLAVPVRVMNGKGTESLRAACNGDNDVYAAVLPLFEADHVDIMRSELLQRITAYDKSDRVNNFILDGKSLRLDKDTRVGLMNSTMIQKNAGVSETTLWFEGMCYVIPVDVAIQMLSQLEMFLLEGYNVTATHKKNAEALMKGFETYDYTAGYPETPVFNTK